MGASHALPEKSTGSLPVPGSETEGSSPIRRHPAFVSKELKATPFPGVNTLYDVFQRGLRESRDGPCMGYRPKISGGAKDDDTVGDFVWLTYAQCQDLIDALGSGLIQENLIPASEESEGLRLLGLFSKNRYEWVIAEQACNSQSAVVVPLYDTLGVEAVAYVLNQTRLATVMAGSSEAAMLLKVKAERAEHAASLTTIVQYEDATEEEIKAAETVGVRLLSFSTLLEIGMKHKHPHNPPTPDQVATFCYTSGTTGDPKGAMLTHRNIVADLAGAVDAGVVTGKDDVHLSYLPLAHMFERVVQASLWCGGGAIGFFQGNTLKLMDDLKVLRPTLFPSVPRLFNKIYDKIMTGVNSAGGMMATMFNKAFAAKQYWLKRNSLEHKFWDTLVFSKIRARVGLDRCRLMLTGSAPIAGHVMEFLRIVFGCPVLEGYGQTECAAAATVTSFSDHASVGHVGGVLSCNEIKLVSVPEMDYLVTDTAHGKTETNPGVPCLGRGEICYRGHNIFLRYFKNPEKTAEAKDADGWLHSGDIGLFTPEGNLRIIDRKKNIFKLSQGEYVAAEKIENIYTRSPFVAQAFIYGDSFQSCLVGIIVPDADHLRTWAPANGIAGTTMAEWAKDPAVKAAIQEDMKRVAKEAKLFGFETAKDIHVHPELFTVENDLLTPTFKLKRPVAKRVFQANIDAMYASGLGVVAGRTGLKQGETGVEESKE